MTQLEDAAKLAIREYVAELERDRLIPLDDAAKQGIQVYVTELEGQREDKLYRRIGIWSAIIGVSFASLVSGSIVSIYSFVKDSVGSTVSRAEAIARYTAREAAIAKTTEYLQSVSLLKQQGEAANELIRAQTALGVAKYQIDDVISRSAKLLAEAERKSAELEQRRSSIDMLIANAKPQGTSTGNITLPSKMIVAFATGTGCPDGWEIYQPAVGRFMIGAGESSDTDATGTRLSNYPFLTRGGAEAVSLRVTNLPTMTASIPVFFSPEIAIASGGAGGDRFIGERARAAQGRAAGQIHEEVARFSGENRPFPILPPFLALTFCINK